MSGVTFLNPAQRIGKIKGEILAHAVPTECLGITGQNKKYDKNKGDTIIYRRWLPFGGATTNSSTINQWVVDPAKHITQEGVTPPADSLTPQDITVVMLQYSCLYMYTDKSADIYEDDLPAEFKIQTGQRMGLVREMIRYGELKSGTNSFYAGGTSRSTVVSTVSYNLISKIARSLLANHAAMITNTLSASPNFGTAPVEPGFLVFCHTDMEHDIRLLPNFKQVSEYGSRKPVHDMELGSLGRFRFIVSPELGPYIDSGGSVTGTTLVSTSGSLIDVYPIIVVAQDAWGDVALRGLDSFDTTDLKPNQKDKNDPHGQRGYYGAKFWSAAKVLNQGHLAVLEAGVTALS